MKHALFFPGQGSQQVGMGGEIFRASSAARAVFEEADDTLGFSISSLCFDGPEKTLALTANTQPAILATSIATLAAVRERCDLAPCFALGHSLGEFSALVSAGAISFADAVRLVRLRGQAMQEAVPAGQGAMAAILRVSAEEIEALCAQEAHGEVLAPANENGGGQVVVAGTSSAVERLVTAVKGAGGKAIPLKVSAPFHCSLMQPAADSLAEALNDVEICAMKFPVIANVDAEPNMDATRVKALLVAQVTGRVRWEASVLAARGQGAERGLEIGHGSVLKGLVRRISRELKITSIGNPTQLETFVAAENPAS